MSGEAIALPILLLALLLVFRGWRAALMPLTGALVTVAGALLLLLAVDQAHRRRRLRGRRRRAVRPRARRRLLPADRQPVPGGTRRRRRPTWPTAVVRTVTTAGRTISFSAMTVIASLAGLFAFGDPTFTSLAIGGIATVLVALAAGLTLVPALLGHRWGAQDHSPPRSGPTDEGFFGRLARRVHATRSRSRSPSPAVLLAAGAAVPGVTSPTATPRRCPPRSRAGAVNDTLLAAVPRHPGRARSRSSRRARPSDPRVTAYAEQLSQLPGRHRRQRRAPGLTGNVLRDRRDARPAARKRHRAAARPTTCAPTGPASTVRHRERPPP